MSIIPICSLVFVPPLGIELAASSPYRPQLPPSFDPSYYSFLIILSSSLVAVLVGGILVFFVRFFKKRLEELYKRSKVKLIILVYVIILVLLSTGFGLEMLFLHLFIQEEMVKEMIISFYLDSFRETFLLALIAISFTIPSIIPLFRAYERNFTPLTRSSLEVLSGFLCTFILMVLIPSLFTLPQGLDVFVSTLVHGIESSPEYILTTIFAMAFTLPALRYLDEGQRIPYISLLQIYFTTLILACNLFALRLLQSDNVLVHIFSALLLSPLIITLLWVLVSDVRLKFSDIKRVSDRGFLEIVDELRRKAGIKKQVEVYSAPAVSGFARVLGIRKPVLVVSENALKLGSRIKPVIMHELIHFRNLDILAHEISRVAFSSTILCSVAFLFLFILFPFPEAEINEVLLNFWSLLLLPNALSIFAVEKWCYRLREVHADLSVQESGMDIASLLKAMFPRKKKRGFLTIKSESYERIRHLKELYRAFIPSYSEGFVLAIILSYVLALLNAYLYSLIWEESNLLIKILFPLFLVSMVTFYLLSKVQLRELDKQLSKAGIKSTPRFIISNSRRPVAGFLAGFMLLFISAELVNLVSYILR